MQAVRISDFYLSTIKKKKFFFFFLAVSVFKRCSTEKCGVLRRQIVLTFAGKLAKY